VTVPVIDAGPLFGRPGAARERFDRALGTACESIGFCIVTGEPVAAICAPERIARLFRFFALDEARRRPLARQRYEALNPNRYRGYFPTTDGEPTFKEGIDIGPEFAPDDPLYARPHPLIERNRWPAESDLPGWRAEILEYWDDMIRLGGLLMQALGRHLGLGEHWFDRFFVATNSTLRLLHYPVRTAASLAGAGERAFVRHDGVRRPVVAAEHADSGVLTLLYQDGVGGLQVKRDGWIDVAPIAGSYVVNLGAALQLWTGDRLVATPHRVLGGATERYSLPFFFEPSVDAPLSGLPSDGPPRHQPIAYGDFLIEAMQRFVETRGVARG
jgi:isopenicillin N synthase-like dioxygenase